MILFVDACARTDSRTRRLAKYLAGRITEKTGDSVTEIGTCDLGLPDVDEKFLIKRDICLEKGNFDGDVFIPAKLFAGADQIVIAAPYWDLSFPASLKKYLEYVNTQGITFRYREDGTVQKLCRAKRLFYVTTAGGHEIYEEYGYGYVKALAEEFYGIENTYLIKASGLDIYGCDVEAVLSEAERSADSLIEEVYG